MTAIPASDLRILVTGGARGIGAATARLLAADGARVMIADLLDAPYDAVVAQHDLGANPLSHGHLQAPLLALTAGSALLGVGVALAAVSLLMSFTLNVNRISMHDVYRNRLIRAFLGASRTVGR